MIYFFRNCLLIFAVFLSSCSELEKETFNGFTEKKGQAATERTVRNLTPVDSLNSAEAFDGLSISELKLNKVHIFVKVGDQIVRLNKHDLTTEIKIKIPEGRGPGEVINRNVTSFDVGNGGLAVYDAKALKTVIYDLDGIFRREFLNGGYQVREMAMADESTYYFELMPGREYLFYEVKRKENESMVTRRFQEMTEGRNLLAYSGTIEYHNNALYFAGYSEPVIRRYDLTGDDAELVFSRAVIDDFDSDKNYVTPQDDGDFRIWRYTENAKFASEDLAADDHYLYSVRHHNDEDGYKYLDIYSVEDGGYVGSFSLLHYPLHIAIDDEHIYSVEVLGDVRRLIKYQKPKMDF